MIIALNVAILLVLAGGTAAYGALSKTVTVAVDGKTDTIRTFGGSVGDVLAARKVDLHPGDRVNHTKAASVDDGDHIEVAYAKPVTVAVDGKTIDRTAHAPTVGEVLQNSGVSPDSDAFVSAKPSSHVPRSGMEIVVSNPKKVTVEADGDSKTVTSAAPKVKDVLKQADVSLDKDDQVSPSRGALVAKGEKLKVTRIDMVDKTETVTEDAPVEYKDDDGMAKGKTKVIEKGKPGKTREHVLITKANGKERSRLVLTSEELQKPVKRVVKRGTASSSGSGSASESSPSVSGNSVWDKIAQCESGGNWHINTGNGYYGGLQFSAATWHSVGGPGLPHQHSRETQIKYAKILQKRSGWGQWGCAGARFN